ncbi:transcriptional repressor [Parvularcula sp. ZS-1/3]|uniref:Transcriptional repressor n=1 Tax=Parvularcula mediterranea TaxID=2732508 RepID=A0A7Y3RNK7_9PROT|nr:transcriptional repressor [Parvularcula mediterranea]NNU17399.1 transcriptional repressor [Parvularcula mediterranea]
MSLTAIADSPRALPERAKLTRNDRMVLDSLRGFGRPMKAFDLLESLRHEGINAPMTVYRALSRLAEKGKVRKIESLNAFYAIPPEAEDASGAFLLCQTCGSVEFQKVDAGWVESLLPDRPILDASIELKVVCSPGCRKH